MDIGERVQNVEEGYGLNSTGAGQNPGPMTRSVFRLVRDNSTPDLFTQDEFVRYGQTFRLEANPHMFRKRLQLLSQTKSPTVSAPLSLNQIAFMSAARANSDGLWVLDHHDPLVRFEMQGEVVKNGEPLHFRHVNTCVYLAADSKFRIKNDFGSENEVHCENHSTKNKSQNLALEQDGRLTVDVPTKFQMAQNTFFLETAPDASYARAIEELSNFDVNECMRDLKSKVYDRSVFGMKALQAIFQAMDQKGDHCLDCDDFRWGLIDFGLQISKEDAAELANCFGSNGRVNFSQFMNALRVSLIDHLFNFSSRETNASTTQGDHASEPPTKVSARTDLPLLI